MMSMNTFHIVIIQTTHGGKEENSEKGNPWGDAVVNKVLFFLALFWLQISYAQFSGWVSEPEWSNPQVAVNSELFKAINLCFMDFSKNEKNYDVHNYNISSGYGHDGIRVIFSRKLSDENPIEVESKEHIYWVNTDTFDIKRTGINTGWFNFDVVMPMDLFYAAHIAYEHSLKHFDEYTLRDNYVLIGLGKLGISVKFRGCSQLL
jgi:hypothetical protein